MGLFDNFTSVTCLKCHITFGIMVEHNNSLKREGAIFYCPNGHGQAYTNTDVSKLQAQVKQLESEVQSATNSKDYWIREYNLKDSHLRSERNSNRTLRGVITKLKKKKNSDGQVPPESR